MNQVVRAVVVAFVLTAAVWVVFATGAFGAVAASAATEGTSSAFSRRDLLLGLLTLGVLCFAAYGFDLREWL